ncbi:hypothetical protein L873DRAFT_1793426 [Choiromyces venosus 120613-1]|uniref:Uncharacterized protein n=1 Tax=Choiromyces venosus 120613-1 TaxID=1336337 RepID=A0A3N4JAK3_9PEZI|nr:hypothetical protein L873DRAFT_1793426 [Choiromyces venosus 120613-1]
MSARQRGRAPGPNFSNDEESASSSPHPPPTSETNQPSYQELITQINLLHETFQALQNYLLVVQDWHIQDTQALKDEVAALSSKVALLETQLQHQTTTPLSTLPTLQQQQQLPTWKIALPAVLTKHDGSIVIERDGTALPNNTNTLTICNVINSAIKKPLIVMIEFTTNHYVLLIIKDNTPATFVLKHHRFAIEEAIRATIPAAISLRKDEIWYKVILHGIPTNSSFTTVQVEIEEFNPGIHLPHLPRWLTTEARHQNKAASALVLTIATKDSTDKALSKGLSLFGRKFKPLATTPANALGKYTVPSAPKSTQYSSTPAADQIVLSRAKHAFTPLSNALTAKTPTKQHPRNVSPTSRHTRQQLRGETGLLRFSHLYFLLSVRL